MAVDREFACILLMCIQFFALRVPFNCLWSLFCFPWVTLGFLLGAFGAPWAPKGPSLVSLWSPLGSRGTPWGHLGHLGLPRGAWDDFGSKLDVQFRANGFQVARLRTKSDLAEFSRVCRVWVQSGAGAVAPNPTSLAPGARMTVVKHTPSKYRLIFTIYTLY